MPKLNDWVMVVGDGNECYQIIGVKGNRVFLNSGVWEPKDKCTVVDEEKISAVIHYYYHD
jgi:hypothetical protein